MDNSNIKQVLGGMDAEDIRKGGSLLIAELGCDREAVSAAMYDIGTDSCESLVLSSTMGFDDIDGMDDATEISKQEGGEPLVELLFPTDTNVEAGDFSGFRLVLWNRSGGPMTIEGNLVEDNDFLIVSEVRAEELQAICPLAAKWGGVVYAG